MFKKGDKVFFGSQGTMYEGILVSNVYRVFTEKEIYADIYYNNLSKESIRELGKQVALLKKSDYANYIMAQAYYESAEYSKALQYINKALDMKFNAPVYLQYKSKILCNVGDYKQSLKIIDKLLSTENIYKFQHKLVVYFLQFVVIEYHLFLLILFCHLLE